MKKRQLADFFPETVKWWVYVCTDLLLNRQKEENELEKFKPADKDSDRDESGRSFHWLFCSTIGELLACKPFIAHIAKNHRIVLLTDRSGYQEAFLHHFPSAFVTKISGRRGENSRLLDAYPPKALYLCEIPCMPNDAPCRLSYGLLRAVKNRNARVYLVNGWVYGYEPSCRQDALERAWFTRDYLALFDQICVQSREIKQKLVEHGAKEERVHVTGNMKFDVLGATDILEFDDATQRLQRIIRENGLKTVVAGCLAEKSEYKDIAWAGKILLNNDVIDLLIVAPRHPDNPEHMRVLSELLEQTGYHVVMKSKLFEQGLQKARIIVLDTIGELAQIYSLATAAYVGTNHNVLEPLKFGKPVIVQEGWEEDYPSYPVYKAALESGLVREVRGASGIASEFERLFRFGPMYNESLVKNKLSDLSGALDRTICLINEQ